MTTGKKERLERYKKQRESYLKAEDKILSGAQSYTIGSRTVTRADLSEIAKRITHLDNQIDKLERKDGKRAAYRIIPRDI